MAKKDTAMDTGRFEAVHIARGWIEWMLTAGVCLQRVTVIRMTDDVATSVSVCPSHGTTLRCKPSPDL